METLKEITLLEYNEEGAIWHYNRVHDGHIPHDKPDTNGWKSVAFTFEGKAAPFTHMVDCRNEWRKKDGLPTLTIEEVRREWALFCYQYNYTIKNPCSYGTVIELIYSTFDSARELAKLGHPAFCNQPGFKGSEKAWDYDPLSFMSANFLKK